MTLVRPVREKSGKKQSPSPDKIFSDVTTRDHSVPASLIFLIHRFFS